MQEDYKNREIDEKFGTLEGKLVTMHDENKGTLARILEQTKLTNGRVTKHDDTISVLRDDSNINRGWIKGLAVSITIIIAMGIYIFNFMTSEDRIKGIVKEGFHDAIQEAIKTNNP